MPSPFPGMDPYLEGPSWMNVHAQLSAEIVRQLAPRLRPRYLAQLSGRFVIEMTEGVARERAALSPDAGVVEAGRPGAAAPGAAVAAAPLRMATLMPEAIPHLTVEIRDRAERRLVASIEVLSPTNKRGGGREEYLSKRHRVLLSPAHLLEIDLLREGQRVPMRQTLPSVPYFVFLSRAECRPETEVWPIPLEAPLPTVPIPLLPGDADIPLELQLALATIYDLCAYDLAVDYSGPPDVPLPPEQAAWAEGRLRAAGLRT